MICLLYVVVRIWIIISVAVESCSRNGATNINITSAKFDDTQDMCYKPTVLHKVSSLAHFFHTLALHTFIRFRLFSVFFFSSFLGSNLTNTSDLKNMCIGCLHGFVYRSYFVHMDLLWVWVFVRITLYECVIHSMVNTAQQRLKETKRRRKKKRQTIRNKTN